MEKSIAIILDDKEYIKSLNLKFREELDEYYENEDVEEKFDLVELIQAILKRKEISLEEFEHIRLKKRGKSGGFEQKLCLISIED